MIRHRYRKTAGPFVSRCINYCPDYCCVPYMEYRVIQGNAIGVIVFYSRTAAIITKYRIKPGPLNCITTCSIIYFCLITRTYNTWQFYIRNCYIKTAGGGIGFCICYCPKHRCASFGKGISGQGIRIVEIIDNIPATATYI